MKNNQKRKNAKKKKSFFASWTFKVILLSLVLTAFFSMLAELTLSMNQVYLIVLILLVLIVIGIFFDAVGTAVTSCDIGPLTAMASRKVKAAKTAIRLVNNAEKVSSFCGDVIGDIFGIISGACIAALAVKAAVTLPLAERTLTIILSSITAATTIGGKAYCKKLAIKRSKDFVMFAANVVYFFRKR
ncbi:MAG: hypothetical protein LBT20_04955 [Clostridiales bacterium]|jgi:CBS domain containing-hemolysin-like protein|nr:hypothetical protein [Clostridiales bacterium]